MYGVNPCVLCCGSYVCWVCGAAVCVWLVLAWCYVVVLNRIVFVTVVCTVVAIFGSPSSSPLRMYPGWFYSTVNWMD